MTPGSTPWKLGSGGKSMRLFWIPLKPARISLMRFIFDSSPYRRHRLSFFDVFFKVGVMQFKTQSAMIVDARAVSFVPSILIERQFQAHPRRTMKPSSEPHQQPAV